MENKKKLSLASIKIKSFVTALDNSSTSKIIGGDNNFVTANDQYCMDSVPGYCLNQNTNNDCSASGCGNSASGDTEPTNTGGGGGKTDGQCIEDSGICSGLPVGCG